MLTAQQMEHEFKKTGAKSILKKTDEKKNTKGISFGVCQIYEYDKDPMNNSVAKKID